MLTGVLVNALPVFTLVILAAPWIIGFGWVRPDANMRGQPGVLWALLTFPLSWAPILAYLIVRGLTRPTRR